MRPDGRGPLPARDGVRKGPAEGFDVGEATLGLLVQRLGDEGVDRFADMILGLEAQNSVSSVLAAGKPQMVAAE